MPTSQNAANTPYWVDPTMVRQCLRARKAGRNRPVERWGRDQDPVKHHMQMPVALRFFAMVYFGAEDLLTEYGQAQIQPHY